MYDKKTFLFSKFLLFKTCIFKPILYLFSLNFLFVLILIFLFNKHQTYIFIWYLYIVEVILLSFAYIYSQEMFIIWSRQFEYAKSFCFRRDFLEEFYSECCFQIFKCFRFQSDLHLRRFSAQTSATVLFVFWIFPWRLFEQNKKPKHIRIATHTHTH